MVFTKVVNKQTNSVGDNYVISNAIYSGELLANAIYFRAFKIFIRHVDENQRVWELDTRYQAVNRDTFSEKLVQSRLQIIKWKCDFILCDYQKQLWWLYCYSSGKIHLPLNM